MDERHVDNEQQSPPHLYAIDLLHVSQDCQRLFPPARRREAKHKQNSMRKRTTTRTAIEKKKAYQESATPSGRMCRPTEVYVYFVCSCPRQQLIHVTLTTFACLLQHYTGYSCCHCSPASGIVQRVLLRKVGGTCGSPKRRQASDVGFVRGACRAHERFCKTFGLKVPLSSSNSHTKPKKDAPAMHA